jgi:hypothetical protein
MSQEDESNELKRYLSGVELVTMTPEERVLRDRINSYLSSGGYHLRLKNLNVRETDYTHDFVEPIDKWFFEFPAVLSIVQKKVHEWQSSTYPDR